MIIRNIANAMDITTAIFRYYRDTYAEHPEDRKNIEYSVLFLVDDYCNLKWMRIIIIQVHLDNDEDLVTLSGMYEQLKELGYQLSYAR